MALMAICICSWPNVTAPSITSSLRPSASDSTINTPSLVPATTRSSFEVANWVAVGFRTYLPSMYPTRAAPIGPMNGMPEIARAAEAPIKEAISGSTSAFTEITEATTCTSLMNPSGKQRPNRPIDEPRSEGLFLRGAPLTFEESSGNAACGVGFFYVIDRERERNRGPAWPSSNPPQSPEPRSRSWRRVLHHRPGGPVRPSRG